MDETEKTKKKKKTFNRAEAKQTKMLRGESNMTRIGSQSWPQKSVRGWNLLQFQSLIYFRLKWWLSTFSSYLWSLIGFEFLRIGCR